MLKSSAVVTSLHPADDSDTSAVPERSQARSLETPAAERVRRMVTERTARSSFFCDSLFAEPAWDMLLDLYCAHLAQQRACVTSVCAASSVPLSTAVRWLKALEGQGLVRRSQDPLDSRRYFVSLTPEGLEKMTRYLEAVSAAA